MFIVFEGIDATGKTALSSALFKNLQDKGRKVIKLSFPSQYHSGKLVRNAIVSNKSDEELSSLIMDDFVKSMPKINALLEEGYTIISDRYIYSYMAYQGEILGDKKMLKDLDRIEYSFINPDITYIIHANKSNIENRLFNRCSYKAKCNIEAKGTDFLMKVQRRYRAMNGDNLFFIDSSNKKVYNLIKKILRILNDFENKN